MNTKAQPTPEQYGYIVAQADNGKWYVADPQDDPDGFFIECDTYEECVREWNDWFVEGR